MTIVAKILNRIEKITYFKFNANSIFCWLYALLLFQLYFYILAIVGGVLLGVFPALYSINKATVNLIKYGELTNSGKLVTQYQNSFKHANILGYLFFMIAFVVYINASYSHLFGKLSLLLYTFSIVALAFVLISCNFAFVIMSRHNLTIFDNFKLAIAYTFGHLLKSVLAGCLLISLYLVFKLFPILMVCLSVSCIVFIEQWVFGIEFVDKTK